MNFRIGDTVVVIGCPLAKYHTIETGGREHKGSYLIRTRPTNEHANHTVLTDPICIVPLPIKIQLHRKDYP